MNYGQKEKKLMIRLPGSTNDPEENLRRGIDEQTIYDILDPKIIHLISRGIIQMDQ